MLGAKSFSHLRNTITSCSRIPTLVDKFNRTDSFSTKSWMLYNIPERYPRQGGKYVRSTSDNFRNKKQQRLIRQNQHAIENEYRPENNVFHDNESNSFDERELEEFEQFEDSEIPARHASRSSNAEHTSSVNRTAQYSTDREPPRGSGSLLAGRFRWKNQKAGDTSDSISHWNRAHNARRKENHRPQQKHQSVPAPAGVDSFMGMIRSNQNFHNNNRSIDNLSRDRTDSGLETQSTSSDSNLASALACSDQHLYARDPETMGKRQRKKYKVGFITDDSQDSGRTADGEFDLLSGPHSVGLALRAGRRRVYVLFYKRQPSPRVQQLVALCDRLGVATRPVSAVALDVLARGTGVHQGVCARVGPLVTRDFDSLLRALDEDASADRTLPATDHNDSVILEADSSDIGGGGVDGGDGGSGGVAVSPECGTPRNTGLLAPDDKDRSVPLTDAVPTHLPPPLSADSSLQLTQPECAHMVTHTTSSDIAALEAPLASGPRFWVMLDRIQDPMNMGSLVRTCYFMGVERILVTEMNSCRLSSTVSKASAGVLEVFPVHVVPELQYEQLLQQLCERGWQLWASCSRRGQVVTAGGASDPQQVPGASPPSSPSPPSACQSANILLVVGNEGQGVDPCLMQRCAPISIEPGRRLVEGVDSLNVGVATGIIISQLRAGIPMSS